jgi:(2Fe-2S) ferredoxin
LTFDSTYRIHLCLGPRCSARDSTRLVPYLYEALARAGLLATVEVLTVPCRDRCDWGPSMNVYPGPTFYFGVDESVIDKIIEQHLVGGVPVREHIATPVMSRRSR